MSSTAGVGGSSVGGGREGGDVQCIVHAVAVEYL